MSAFDSLREDMIKVPLNSATKPDVIEELVDILVRAGRIKDRKTVLDDVRTREEQKSTGLEKGVAVPHGKTTAVTELLIAVGISPRGIEFEAMDGQPTHLFFLVLSPPNETGPHIQALREIAFLVGNGEKRAAIIGSSGPAEALKLLRSS